MDDRSSQDSGDMAYQSEDDGAVSQDSGDMDNLGWVAMAPAGSQLSAEGQEPMQQMVENNLVGVAVARTREAFSQRSAAMPHIMQVVPPTPMQLAQTFGSRLQFQLRGLSIVHSRSGRGWIALQVTELYGGGVQATGLDAHVTLLYVLAPSELVARAAQSMTTMLQQILNRRGANSDDFIAWGAENKLNNTGTFAMVDLIVGCRAYDTCYRLASAGILSLPQEALGKRRALHLSIRPSTTGRLTHPPTPSSPHPYLGCKCWV